MSTISVTKYYIVIIGFLIFVLYAQVILNENSNETILTKPDSISKIVLRDISILGNYDSMLSTSVKYWIYGIESCVYLYDKELMNTLFDNISTWNKKYNIDTDGIIYHAIQDAHTLILAELDNAREEKRNPNFKISNKFDYHKCSSVIRYSDYVDEDKLIEIVDRLLGGVNVG